MILGLAPSWKVFVGKLKVYLGCVNASMTEKKLMGSIPVDCVGVASPD